MKKNLGSLLALYPTPVTVIGAMNGEKPTWTLVAHVGIIGHDRILVSLAAPHFINGCIKETKKLSINLVNEEMLPYVDYVGSVSGAKTDKSAVFAYDEADVIWLKKIRLLRMLDVPIEEIRRMKDGQLTLADAMERHLVQLQRRRYTLDSMTALCTHLRDSRE